MPMDKKGLTKLMEECGELTQIAAKKSAYMHTDTHPDGKGSMKVRMEEEIADVLATCDFVADRFNLDTGKIKRRAKIKLMTFNRWDANPDN